MAVLRHCKFRVIRESETELEDGSFEIAQEGLWTEGCFLMGDVVSPIHQAVGDDYLTIDPGLSHIYFSNGIGSVVDIPYNDMMLDYHNYRSKAGRS